VFTQRDTPRTDCPTSLPYPPLEPWRYQNQHKQPLNDLQRSLVQLAAAVNGELDTFDVESFATEEEGANYIEKQMEKLLGRPRSRTRQ